MGYTHLTINEREVILKMQAQQSSLEQMAERLGRSKGTISRELRRNVSSTGDYKPHLAQRYYTKRRQASKAPYRLETDAPLRGLVEAKLKRYWSPEQIIGWLRKSHTLSLSLTTLYSWVYRDKANGGTLWTFLRQRRRRKRRVGEDRRGQLPDRRMIDERPAIANARQRLGDWEGDTVEGRKGSGYFATYVDRASRYTAAAKTADKSAPTITAATLAVLGVLPAETVKTITFDNGKEFAGFKELERTLEMDSYFAHPYHSWERGSNENTNGLLRQFFPKGMDFSTVDQRDLDIALELLNNRPRKCLNYRTPAEVFWSQSVRCASD